MWDQFCNQKKFGDNVFSCGSGWLPQYQQNFVGWYCFAHIQPLLFSYIRCSFEQNTRNLNVYLRNLSDNLPFLFFIFGVIFFGAHNVCTIPFSGMQPWETHFIKFHTYSLQPSIKNSTQQIPGNFPKFYSITRRVSLSCP